jgi:dUTP pyrophosphatase
MRIYIKYHNPACKVETHGNWIDLKSAESVELRKWQFKLIPLGVSMKLPKYYQANIVPRSGTFIKYNLIQHNHYGVVDGPDAERQGYSGNNDIWKFGAIAFEKTSIKEGDRLCQFEIRPIMTAPWYVKLKWIFDSKIKFIEVDDLKSTDRGGFGQSGK